MKHSLTPTTCTIALTCMIAAGVSHWWSVKQLVVLMDDPEMAARTLASRTDRDARPSEPSMDPISSHVAAPAANPSATPAPSSAKPLPTEPLAMQQFYQELIREMQNLRTENRDLLNQVAETNRDLMKLEFRVDTHSEQFRPLPVSEDTFGTGFDDGPGLLPPRAEPVVLPLIE